MQRDDDQQGSASEPQSVILRSPCSPATQGLGPVRVRLVNIRRLHPVPLRGDVMAARMKLWWGSKLAMVDGLVGALARALADGSHV
jgi:hypothetical protein